MAMSAHRRSALESRQEQARLHTLAQLAGSVSHAIQSPLTTIFLHADILEEELHQWPHDKRTQLLDSLRVIREEITRVHDLVEQHLLLSRLPALVLEPEGLGAFLESLVHDIAKSLARRGIVFHLEGKAAAGVVAMHKKALQRALLYLLEAVAAMSPGARSITLHIKDTTAEIRLEIGCEGAGAAPEEFPQFLAKARGEGHDYTALGFSLAQEIVATHGGTIDVTSQPGANTMVSISLPPLASQTSAQGLPG